MIDKNTFHLIQIILSIILAILILLQTKGAGLGSTFGGDMSFYQTRRGVEKIVFSLTIAVAALFLIASFLGLFLS